jgi:hypothetical protein
MKIASDFVIGSGGSVEGRSPSGHACKCYRVGETQTGFGRLATGSKDISYFLH